MDNTQQIIEGKMVQPKHLTEMSTEEKKYLCNSCKLWEGTIKEMVFRDSIDYDQHECPKCLSVLFSNSEQDIENCTQVPPVDPQSVLSAEEYLISEAKDRASKENQVIPSDEEIADLLDTEEVVWSIQLLNGFANLRVEHEREKWEKENSDFVKRFNLIADICDLSILVNIK